MTEQNQQTVAAAHASTQNATRLSSPLRRLGGHILEMLFFGVVPFLSLILAFAIGEVALILGGLLFLGVVVWELWCWTRSKTIGKHLLGMTVVNKDTGQQFGFVMMLLREVLGKFISGMVFSLGFIWVLIDPDSQGWHDKLISSVVIDD